MFDFNGSSAGTPQAIITRHQTVTALPHKRQGRLGLPTSSVTLEI